MTRVLIIEDDRDISEALTDVLLASGYQVTAARNGAEGLASARRSRPDVILLDLMMPVMDGWQFRAHQKGDPEIASVPVIVVSAVGRRPEIDVAAILQKPCRIDQILEAIEAHVHGGPGAPAR